MPWKKIPNQYAVSHHSFLIRFQNTHVIVKKAIEGWIVIVRGLHEETDEESLTERFMEYGTIKNVHLNLDRRTGYVKVKKTIIVEKGRMKVC